MTMVIAGTKDSEMVTGIILRLSFEKIFGALMEKGEQMSDLIDRQAAIDATWKEPTYSDPLNVLTEVRDRIEALPSAQPKIIRCKDCKWFGDIGCSIRIVDDSDKPTENDFCSFAERRRGMTEIKPCPFCGRKVFLFSDSRTRQFTFVHDGLRNCPFYKFEISWECAKSLKEASELWNRRGKGEEE